MVATIIDGREISAQIRTEVAQGVSALGATHSVTPGLAAVLVGDDPASAIYVRNKGKACEEVGIYSEIFTLNADISQSELLGLVNQLNDDPKFHGILVQLPLPSQINERVVTLAIDPTKDVDGFHPFNIGLLMEGRPRYVSATPAGVQQLLMRSGYDPSGKHVVICGRSNIVGKPLAALMLQKANGANATVTVCHTGTPNLEEITRTADILVVAMGRASAVTAEMIREGAIVIDVGTNRVEDSSRKSGYRLVGDVDYDNVVNKAEAITPVPGGVGPMTIAMLLSNTLLSARLAVGATED